MSKHGFILNNANIVQDGSNGREPRSILLEGSRIVSIDDPIRSLPGNARVIDLQGATVVPGFINTHCHIGSFGQKYNRVSLDGARSIEEICRRIAARVRSASADETIVTTPIGDSPYFFNMPDALTERRFPTRHDLDAVAAEHPVWISAANNRSPNMSVLNTAALRRLGLMQPMAAMRLDGARVEDRILFLDGIEVLLGDDGLPTGQVRGAQELYNASKHFPMFAALLEGERNEVTKGILASARDRVHDGVTSVLENHGATLEELEIYGSNELPLRVFYAYNVDTSQDLATIESMFRLLAFARRPRFGDGRLFVVGVGVDIDGTHSAGQAFSDKPYVGPSGKMVQSRPFVEEAKYEAILRLAARYGLRVHTCAAGRGAIGMALRTFDRIHRDFDLSKRRWLIEHALFPTAEHIAAARRLGVIVTTATNFVWGQYSEVWKPRLGPSYATDGIPLRSWLKGKVCVCQTTDWGPQSMMFTLWQSIARRDGASGEAVSQDERVDVVEGLALMTKNPAYALEMEHLLGSIEAGKLADMTILSKDPREVALEEIPDIDVLGTMVDGEFSMLSGDLGGPGLRS